MRINMKRLALTAASLLLAATVSFAIEIKTPDIKGAAKVNFDGAKTAADTTKAGAKAKIVDINSASEAELKAIPGIGDTYAAKIVAGRPYASKTQLKTRKIVPPPVYEKTKDLIIATQPKK